MNLTRTFGSNARFALLEAEDSELYVWGSNAHGALGINSTESIKETPTRFSLPPTSTGHKAEIKMLACGEYHVLLLTEDGRLFVWGHNGKGQLGLGSQQDCHTCL